MVSLIDLYTPAPADLYFASKSVIAELLKVGPKGYIHGWIFVGAPGVGSRVFHPHHGEGTVRRSGKRTVTVEFAGGKRHAFEHAARHPGGVHPRAGQHAEGGHFAERVDRRTRAGREAAREAAKPAAAEGKWHEPPSSREEIARDLRLGHEALARGDYSTAASFSTGMREQAAAYPELRGQADALHQAVADHYNNRRGSTPRTEPATLADRIAAKETELAQARQRLTSIDTTGSSSMRGTRHGQRVDAGVRRTSAAAEQVQRLDQELAALHAQARFGGRKPAKAETQALRNRWATSDSEHTRALANSKTLEVVPGTAFAVHKEPRGDWQVVRTSDGADVTRFQGHGSKDRETAIRVAQAVNDLRDEHGNPVEFNAPGPLPARLTHNGTAMSAREAVQRAAAGAGVEHAATRVAELDRGRAEHAAFEKRLANLGYTEKVSPADLKPGDDIAYQYYAHGAGRSLVPGLGGHAGSGQLTVGGRSSLDTAPGDRVTIRGTVAGDGKLMDRHGNNYEEFKDGYRFPLKSATWHAQDGRSGTYTPDSYGTGYRHGAASRTPTIEHGSTVYRRPARPNSADHLDPGAPTGSTYEVRPGKLRSGYQGHTVVRVEPDGRTVTVHDTAASEADARRVQGRLTRELAGKPSTADRRTAAVERGDIVDRGRLKELTGAALGKPRGSSNVMEPHRMPRMPEGMQEIHAPYNAGQAERRAARQANEAGYDIDRAQHALAEHDKTAAALRRIQDEHGAKFTPDAAAVHAAAMTQHEAKRPKLEQQLADAQGRHTTAAAQYAAAHQAGEAKRTAAAAREANRPAKLLNPARKGDLAVLRRPTSVTGADSGATQGHRFDVVRVHSTDRAGRVTAFVEGGGRPQKVSNLPAGHQFQIVPQEKVHGDAAMNAAGHRSYQSIDEVKAALRPHLTSSAGAARVAPPTAGERAAARALERAPKPQAGRPTLADTAGMSDMQRRMLASIADDPERHNEVAARFREMNAAKEAQRAEAAARVAPIKARPMPKRDEPIDDQLAKIKEIAQTVEGVREFDPARNPYVNRGPHGFDAAIYVGDTTEESIRGTGRRGSERVLNYDPNRGWSTSNGMPLSDGLVPYYIAEWNSRDQYHRNPLDMVPAAKERQKLVEGS